MFPVSTSTSFLSRRRCSGGSVWNYLIKTVGSEYYYFMSNGDIPVEASSMNSMNTNIASSKYNSFTLQHHHLLKKMREKGQRQKFPVIEKKKTNNVFPEKTIPLIFYFNTSNCIIFYCNKLTR